MPWPDPHVRAGTRWLAHVAGAVDAARDADRQDGEDWRAVTTGERASSHDYDAEIRNATGYERILAVKAIIPLALVGFVVEVCRIVPG